jgi:hypothetical protein
MARPGATHQAAAPSRTPATRDRAGRPHRDGHGRPAACQNPGLLDDSGLASASRPRIARGPQAPGRRPCRRQMSAFFGRGRRIFIHTRLPPAASNPQEQDGRAATGQPEGEDPSAGHGHQQRFACGRSPPGPGPAYSPGRWHAAVTWRPPVRSGTLMDSAARTSGGELRRSPVEMGHALARTAVYVERGGADDHRHDQPMAARPPR